MRVEPLEDRRMLAITVDSLVDEFDGSITDGDISLRDAIAAAADGETIDFSVTGTINLTLGELVIDKNLTITGPGADLLTIDASGNDPTPDVNNGDGSRIFNIDDANNSQHLAVTISGMTLTGGDAGGATYYHSVGGAIYSTESLTLAHIALVDNAAIVSGGGLFARSLNGAVTVIVDSSILNNKAQDGGGIDLAGNGQLTRVLVSGNEANDYYGGGLVLMQGSADYSVLVDDCEIINNSAVGIGGGIVGRYFALQNSRVAGNVAQGEGGGIYMEESFTLQGNEITDNTSNDSGGGVHISIGNDHIAKVIQNNTFARNHSAIGGGGLSTRSRVLLEGNTFEGNTSDRHGGGLVITSNSANNVVVNNQFLDNHAVLDGGGVYVYQEGQNRIEENGFSGNSSGLNGGGMFVEMRSGALALLHNEFVDNSAVQSGGGLYVDTQHDDIAGEITIDENDFVQNNAASGGGFAIVTDADGFSAEVINNSIYENTAGSGGGVGLLVAAGDVEFRGNSVYRNDALGAFSDGGGIQVRNAGGTIRIVNSTISTNDAGSTGGGLSVLTQGGTTSIAHSTIARNNTNSPAGGGGGIFHVGTGLTIDHTIVTNNGSASAVSGLQNLYDLSGSATVTHSLLSGNAMLGDLLDNGGSTLTHALLPGSPAINTGDASAIAGVDGVPDVDQRGEGYGRVTGGRIDIGAFERQPISIVVDTNVDENDGDYSEGDLSLREAVGIANTSLGADVTIEFSEVLSGETILLTQGQLAVTNGVRIVGLGAGLLTIDASGNDPTPDMNNGDGSRIFAFQASNSVVAESFISGLTLTGGDVAGPRGGTGGAIAASGKLTVTNCVLRGNSAGSGGAIFTGSELVVTGSTFTDNSAPSSQGGALGGGGTLLISDSVFADNTARLGGAIGYQFGTVTISDSVIQDNIATHVGGGGIWMGGGSVQVLRSAITGNSAQMDGGGIVAPMVLLEASLISGNSAGQDGGGIHGKVTVTNSTISGNTANRHGGGVAALGGIVTVSHSTISANIADKDANGTGLGGGIWKSLGGLILNQTLIAGNMQAEVPLEISAPYAGAAELEFDYSLIGIADGLSAELLTAITDGVGNLADVDPLLGPLQDNGGPTLTHALLAGSPAIDAGDPAFTSPPDYDQRGAGFERVVGGRIDMGAFEVQAEPVAGDFDGDGDVDGRDFLAWQRGKSPNPLSSDDLALWQGEYGDDELPSLVVTTEIDVVDEFDGLTSLREAIVYANSRAGANEITFDVGLAGKTILLTQGGLTIEDDTTITGLGADLLTIDASGNDPTPEVDNGDGSGIFQVVATEFQAMNVAISGLTLTGADGGAVLEVPFSPYLDDVHLVSCKVTGNHAPTVISGISGNIAIEGCEITNNSGQTIVGGDTTGFEGLYLDIDNTTISNNAGRAVSMRGRSLEITDSVISGNTADKGAGVYLWFDAGPHYEMGSPGRATITNTVISGNTATKGSAIYGVASHVTLTDSTVSGNLGANAAILMVDEEVPHSGDHGGSVSLQNTDVVNNIGDGIRTNFAAIADSEISGNTGTGLTAKAWYSLDGANNATLNITNSRISGNARGIDLYGPFFDFVYGNRRLAVTIQGSEIKNNTTGGGLLLEGVPDVKIIETTISGNHNTQDGGAITSRYDDAWGNLLVRNSTISGNSTDGSGGGIYFYGTLTVEESTISGNSAAEDGGGIWLHGGATADIRRSTIAGNEAGANGGGVVFVSAPSSNYPGSVDIGSSIIANNTAMTNSDMLFEGDWEVRYSLVEDPGTLVIGGPGNIVGVDPVLGPLADNGGPTWTHALLAGSPAIDAGDSAFTSPPDYDQRGEGFARVVGGRIDMGAFEVQSAPVQGVGDFDNDGDVDGRDFLAWQRGDSPVPLSGDDLALWQGEYGSDLSGASREWRVAEGAGDGGLASLMDESESRHAQLINTSRIVSGFIAGTRETRSGLQLFGDEIASEDRFVEEVDRALESLAAVPRFGVPEFGEMVARRALRRVDAAH